MSYIEMEAPEKSEKKVASHPKVSVMVEAAIKNLSEPKGSSLHAINKYIGSNYSVDIQKLSTFIKKYLKAAVERGDLVQPKGKGASGSFKISKQKLESKQKVPKLKAPKPLKMQTSTPKKALKPKKAAQKSPNKSPVRKTKLANEEVHADATFLKAKTKGGKKPKISLPTKPRKSLVFLTKKGKKPKKLPKKLYESNVSISPTGKSNGTTSPKVVKSKPAAKAKKTPKPGKHTSIQKKVASKKAPAKGEK